MIPVKPAASDAKNVEYDISINKAVSNIGCCLMYVNLVNNAVAQPIRAPIENAAKKTEKKL